MDTKLTVRFVVALSNMCSSTVGNNDISCDKNYSLGCKLIWFIYFTVYFNVCFFVVRERERDSKNLRQFSIGNPVSENEKEQCLQGCNLSRPLIFLMTLFVCIYQS